MEIRNIIRKVNRGIVLAVILVFGMIGYLIIDNARFESEKTAINNMLTDYAKEAGNMNILPEDERIHGASPSETVIKNKLQENETILNRYLTNWINYSSALDNARQSLNDIFTQNASRHAYVTGCEYTVKSVKNIKKNGPKHSLADITIHIDVKTIGKPKFFTMISSKDTENQNRYGDNAPKDYRPDDTVDTDTYTYSWDYTLYGTQLEKSEGHWEIAYTNGWSAMDGKLVKD